MRLSFPASGIFPMPERSSILSPCLVPSRGDRRIVQGTQAQRYFDRIRESPAMSAAAEQAVEDLVNPILLGGVERHGGFFASERLGSLPGSGTLARNRSRLMGQVSRGSFCILLRRHALWHQKSKNFAFCKSILAYFIPASSEWRGVWQEFRLAYYAIRMLGYSALAK